MPSLEDLQTRLGAVWSMNQPGGAAEHVVVVLPSLNLAPTMLTHYRPRMCALEHRYVTEMLMLARVPGCEVVFVCSEDPGPEVLDYYLGLMPHTVRSSARERMHVVTVPGAQGSPVSARLLASPAALSRVAELVAGRPGMIEPWNVTLLEAAIAERLGLPLNGTAPELWPLAFKSSGRRVMHQAKVPTPLGREGVRNLDDVAAAMDEIRRAHPHARGVVVKHDNSGAGDGNLVLSLRDRDGHALSAGVLRRLLEESVPEWYTRDLAAGGVVEELVSGRVFTSPSAQVDIAPDGSVHVVATHEQVLSGDSRQVYAGCSLPANRAYTATLAAHARAVGRRLSELGARGRLSVDFVAVKRRRWEVFAIEVNLRKGGTTHPLTVLRNLVPGRYDTRSGDWVCDADGSTRCYTATDNLLEPAWKGLEPAAAIDAVAAAGLEFDRSQGVGVVLHMLSGLAVDGRCGMTAIAHTLAEADQLTEDTRAALDRVRRGADSAGALRP